jgi:hypothetical protein
VTYRFATNGSCTVYHQLRSFATLNLGYVGFIQAAPMSYSGKKLWQYVPRSLPVVGSLATYDFKAQADISTLNEGVMVAAAAWEDANNPPDRFANIVKETGGTPYAGFLCGYSPLRGAGVPATRKTLNGTAFYVHSTKKQYPYGISSGGSAITGNQLVAGDLFEAVAYRAPFNTGVLPESTVFTWVQDGSDILVFLDFHQTVTRISAPLPARFTGRKVTVVDKTASLTLHGGEFVSADGLLVSVSGGYGYGVFKLSA